MMDYEFHPLCMVLPEMPADRYAELVSDIRKKGLFREITLYDGKILDGRHRYLACKEAGVEPRFEMWTGDPVAFVVSAHLQRDLTKSQRGLIAAGFLEYEREQAKKRMSAGGGDRKSGPENLPDPIPDTGDARDRAGARVGVSGKTVDQAEKVIEKAAPAVVEKVRSGEMALNEAVKVIELNPASQKRIAAIEDKKERAKALSESLNSSRTKRAQHNRIEAPALPGTPFVRELLGTLERTTIRLSSEYKLKDPGEISARFLTEFDWSSSQLRAQLDLVMPLVMAIAGLASDIEERSAA